MLGLLTTRQKKKSDSMPKPKPDNIVRHEIVLGRAERELLRDVRLAYMFNKVADPTVKLLNDVTGMAAILFILEMFFDVPYFAGPTDLEQVKNDFANYMEQNKDIEKGEDRTKPENLGSVIYNLTHPNWNFSDFSFDALTGGIFQR
jgi:hypothetical protein